MTIPHDAVIGVRIERELLSGRATPGDPVDAYLARDVLAEGRVALAAGTRIEGVVVSVDRANAEGDRSRLEILFQAIVLADDARVPIQADPIERRGRAGAAPSTTFAAASVPAWIPGDVRLPAGSLLTVKLRDAVTIHR